MDDLTTMIVLGLLAAISNWITTRKQAKAEQEQTLEEAWSEVPENPPTTAKDWEAQMRRLMGEPGDKAPPKPAPPPPPIPAASKVEASQAQKELEIIQARNAQQKKQVAQLSRKRKSGRRRSGSQVHAPHPSAVEWLAHPHTLRQAILAQTILEPPKGLQDLHEPGINP